MDHQSSANKDEGSQQIKARRRRNDQNNRDFTCGCGKSYLSYAALYTHLKHKHESKAPNGTWLPNTANQKTGRGRPRRLDENDPKSAKSDDEKSISYNEPEETLEEMLSFLDSIGNFRNITTFNTEEEKQSFLLENFPQDIFSNRQEYFQILNYMKEITSEKILFPNLDPINKEEIDNDKNIRKTVINKILSYFLIQIGPKLTIEAYRELVIFIIFFSKALNTLGYQAIQVYESDQKGDDNKQQIQQVKSENNLQIYCEEQNGEHILLTANEFILQLLPRYYQQLGQNEKNFQIFGSPDEKLKNAVYVTQHLSYWLYSFKFTNSRLALYTEDD